MVNGGITRLKCVETLKYTNLIKLFVTDSVIQLN